MSETWHVAQRLAHRRAASCMTDRKTRERQGTRLIVSAAIDISKQIKSGSWDDLVAGKREHIEKRRAACARLTFALAALRQP